MSGLRRSASDPKLSCSQPLEVFVATRPLLTKLPHVPQHLQAGLLADVGCAHYYTVIRRPSDGQLTQLDFGPIGGDIAFAPKPRRGLWSWACRVVSRTPAVPIGTQAEVREVKLTEMPKSSMYVGNTSLSLSDIRSFNLLQSRVLYLLHKNDCRHYVNSLVHYTTGIQGVTRKATRHIFRARATARRNASTLAWSDRLILLSHTFTDVGSWPRLQKYSKAAAAVIAAVAGRRTLVQLVPSLQLPANPTGFSLARSMLRSAPPGLASIPASASAASLKTMTQPGSTTVVVTQRATFVLRPPPANGTASVLSMATPPRTATHVTPSMLWGLCNSIRSAASSSRQAMRSAGTSIGRQVGARVSSLGSGRALSAGATAVAAGATRDSTARLGHGRPQHQLQLPQKQTMWHAAAVKPPIHQRRTLQQIGPLIM